MTRIGRGAAAAAGVALAAGVAVAQDRETGTAGMPGRSAGTSSPGATGTGATMNVMARECSHEMTGTVKEVDKSTGTVSIAVAGADDLQIHLPPHELAGFEEGDQVVVSLGLRESRAGGGNGGTPTR